MDHAFFAYPGGDVMLSTAVQEAVRLCKKRGITIRPWERMKIVGVKLDDLVRSQLQDAAVLVADTTTPNPNVFYEIGFAVATGKPVILTINGGVAGAVDAAQALGLFDTIGWGVYSNSEELTEIIADWPNRCWTSSYARARNYSQPLFALDTQVKLDFRNWIFSAIENHKVQYRSFDPQQTPRYTALQAVADVSSSAGVVLPFLLKEIVDSERHNLRASFLLGLAHGYKVEALAIQYLHGPVALDYRDFVRNATYRRETENHVGHFAGDVLIWNQRISARDLHSSLNILNNIDLGSATAENELSKLDRYFVPTSEYSRAIRAEGAVVIGRKGSGKSAVQQQASARFSEDKRNCVVDLRPASHNLSEMREALLSVTSAGIFDHTVAAFWQYVLYFEILLKLRENVLPKARNDFVLQQKLSAVEDAFGLTDEIVAGDFTSRLEMAVKSVIKVAETSTDASVVKSQLTNTMFERPIPELKNAIVSVGEDTKEIYVLVDDIDKGWPARKVEAHDVSTVKHLLETLNRMRRELGRLGVSLRYLVFLRSDVYELLVTETSDRGKFNTIRVDWSDVEQLRHLLKQRVISGVDPSQASQAWDAVNLNLKDGQNAIELMIESSLRRPRFLIELCERTLSFAINRGHSLVSHEDVEDGLKDMSRYLVSDFAYEMRDVAGTPESLFYRFRGKGEFLTEGELEAILEQDLLGMKPRELIDLLLWYGFLGITGTSSEAIFIYDRGYDFRSLEAERDGHTGDMLYAVNPAFLRGLRQ